MAASPRFKVYSASGEYIAACKFPEAAAAIIAAIGYDGWTIRDGHRRIVWLEGTETQSASESYDNVAYVVFARS
jgi:hypothetical protein